MDMKEMTLGGRWTEERHAAFLNCIEESFVHQMFNTESNDEACSSGSTCRRLPPLDRAIPDSVTESTHDSPIRRSRQLAEPGNKELARLSTTNRKRKKQLSQLDTSQDQVVPQLGDNSKKKRRV